MDSTRMNLSRIMDDRARQILGRLDNQYYGSIIGLLLACGFACLFGRIAVVIVYRLYFHSLSKFPGPKLGAISDLWTAWYSIKGQSHLKAYYAHQKYGPIVRFGPNKLSISSISSLQEIYNSKDILKSQIYNTITPAPGAYSTFTAIDKETHRRKRRVLSQAFSDQAIKEFEPVILNHVDIFVNQLAKDIPSHDSHDQWSTPLNMTPLSRYYATDCMGDFGFGKSFDIQTCEKNRFLLKAADGAALIAGVYCQYPKLKQYGLGKLVALAGMSTKERFGRLAKQLIDERLSKPEEKKADLLHFISGTGNRKIDEPFSMDEIWAESRFTLIAGAETTGTAITCTLFYLSRHPSCLHTLTDTLRSTFSSADSIRLGPELKSCSYIWACVDESMRLSPSVAAILWREVISSDFFLEGQHIPKGTDVGVSMYVTHHDESIFPDAFAFRPERWLDKGVSSDKDRITTQRLAFNPFSLGSRKCIGIKMAQTEIVLCLARVLWEFDMRVPDDPIGLVGGGVNGASGGRNKEGEFQLYEHVTSRHDGPYLEFAWRAKKHGK